MPARLRMCSATEVWIPIFAGDDELGIDLRQRLCGPLSLRGTCHDWTNAIHNDPNAHVGPIWNETSLHARSPDLGARPRWRRFIRGGLDRRSLVGNRLSGGGLSWSGLSGGGLAQRRAGTKFIEPGKYGHEFLGFAGVLLDLFQSVHHF